MQGKQVLEIAEDNSKVFVAEFSDPSGAAFIGNLSAQMQKEMVQGLAHAIGGTMVNDFPVNISKSKDAKNVKVVQNLYIFTPEDMVKFAGRLFDAAMKNHELAMAQPGGQG
jgi:hypothetical protein